MQTVQSGASEARLRGIRAANAHDAWGRSSQNPPVVGSSPTRPTSYFTYAGLTGAFAVAEVPGESPTAYLETGLQGITVRDPTLVGNAARMFDDLRDEALSRSMSLELIAEVEKP